jgi:hypothetical protein
MSDMEITRRSWELSDALCLTRCWMRVKGNWRDIFVGDNWKLLK